MIDRHQSHGEPRAELLARARDLRRRLHRDIRRRIAFNGGSCVLVLLIVFAVLDFIWPSPAPARAMMLAAIVAACARSLIRTVRPPRTMLFSDADAAGCAELRMLGEEGPARAAVELASRQTESPTAAAEALTNRAIERGLHRIRSFDAAAAVDTRQSSIAVRRLLLIVAVVAFMTLAFPKIAKIQTLRLFDPFGDHPPYTSLRFEITVSPDDLRIGDDIAITGVIAGAVNGPAILAIHDGDGARRVPFRPGATDQRELTIRQQLYDVREPLSIRIETEQGRSRWARFAPAPKPRVRSASVRLIPPSYTREDSSLLALPQAEVVSVIAGAAVEIDLVSSMEIAQIDAAEPLDAVITGRRATAQWRLTEPGMRRLALEVYSSAGLASGDPVQIDVRVLPDEPPRIEVSQPTHGRGSAAPAPVAAMLDAEIPIAARAIDDVVVSTLRCEYAIVDGRSDITWRELVGFVAPARNALQFLSSITPASLGATVGDQIHLRFVAADNRPDEIGGLQTATAGPIVIMVIDEEWLQQRTKGQETGERAQGAAGGDPADADVSRDSEATEGASDAEGEGAGRPGERDPNESAPGEGAGSGGSGRAVSGVPEQSESTGESGAEDVRIYRAPDSRAADEAPQERVENTGTNPLRALPWSAPGAATPLAMQPDEWSRLSEKHRAIIARYYELLAATPKE